MNYNEILSRFKVKRNSSGTAQCICPAHDDKEASLTISRGKDGKTLIYCHAGCSTGEVLAAVGLSLSDLFEDQKECSWMSYVEGVKKKKLEAVYHYYDLSGKYVYSHLRMTGKEFPYGILKDGRFEFSLGGKSRKELKGIYCGSYKAFMKAVSEHKTIFYAEGEKDVNTLIKHGYPAFTCGSAGEWVSECSDLLKGCSVVVLADNDEPGIKSAKMIGSSLEESSVKLIIPTPDIDKGDISDYFKTHSKEEFDMLVSAAPVRLKESLPVLSAAAIEEKTTEWLFPGFIPRYQITVIAGDGGSGKTSIECNIAAAVTTGKQSLFTHDIPEHFISSDPENVLILSGEDDFSRVLKRKLRIAGADMERIFTVPIESPAFNKIKFKSQELEQAIQVSNARLVIFDPLQQFLPPNVDMSRRNAMRDCLSSLIGFGEKYKATFLIVCHSNKQTGNFARRRIADSADIWDIARSVLLVGNAEDRGTKYISHEKSNYGELQQTILFDLDGEQVIYRGRSDKKDADFVRDEKPPRAAPARREAKELVLQTLQDNGGKMRVMDLDNTLKDMGISIHTLRRAKEDLKKEKMIFTHRTASFENEWMVELLVQN